MDRNPDEKRLVSHHGRQVEISIWLDPEDEAWDGEEPLPLGSEGWIATVEARVIIEGESFVGRDSLGGIWVAPNDGYLTQCIDNDLIPQALASLDAEVGRVAQGEDFRRAAKRRAIAHTEQRRILKLEAHEHAAPKKEN